MLFLSNLLKTNINLSFAFGFAAVFIHASPLWADNRLTVGNDYLSRDVSWEKGYLATDAISNRLGQRQVDVSGGDEFALTIAREDSNADERLTSTDFSVQGSKLSPDKGTLDILLSGKTVPLDLTVRYTVNSGERWMRKQLLITTKQRMQIKKVEIEHLGISDAYAAYRANQLTAQGPAKWRPPLGQPVYTTKSGTWWGIEFPAASNEVSDGKLVCGYLTKINLQPGETYASHTSAVGVSDDPAFIKDAFLDYIDATRARPLRLQTQYNSWFDYNRDVDADNFTASVRKVNEELVVERGVPPLRVYAIDAGWQDVAKDWSKVGVWPVSEKFDSNFKRSREEVEQANASLGLWVSPGCLFGSERAIPKMREAGWRSLDPWMSMTDPHYMDALEKRLVQLAIDGVGYFKLDGIFGHLRTRNFDIEGFNGSEKALDETKYDEAKQRYLSLGSERLIKIFQRMGEVNPDVYIVISNGAFLSPWWLQHVDAVWLINVGDHARGNDRTSQLAYRDGAYYQFAAANADNSQFPLNSIFNHEPKKISSDEDAEIFRRYLLMSLSRGTGFVELYLKTFSLSESDWDELADGLKWVHHMFPAFKRARMIGGNPMEGEVYGYTGWTENAGYLSLHNPSNKTREFQIDLNRSLGLPKSAVDHHTSYIVSSPIEEDVLSLPKSAAAGGKLTIKLSPGDIRILEFAGSPTVR